MRRFLTAVLAAAAISSPAALAFAAPAAIVTPATVTYVDDAWHDCRSWDGHRHMCRDREWDRTRWNEQEWYGRGSCREGHDHYINRRGHWKSCH
jgi:Ni/Co efflux regulator RcnB